MKNAAGVDAEADDIMAVGGAGRTPDLCRDPHVKARFATPGLKLAGTTTEEDRRVQNLRRSNTTPNAFNLKLRLQVS